MFSLFKRKQAFIYPNIEPPFQFKPRREMNETEAQEYFAWFTGESESRRKLLLEMIRTTGDPVSTCDYTVESLVPLWRSVSRHFEKRPMTSQEQEALFQNAPDATQRIHLDLVELTTATGCLAIDIGFYVAEVFIRRHPKMNWVICKDKEGPLNEPMITGFRLYLIPFHLVTGCIWRQLKQSRDECLYEAVMHWETKNVLSEFR